MIYLEQNAEYFNNDIRAMLQAFFDNEKVVTKEDGTRLSLYVTYTMDSDVETQVASGGYVTYCLEDNGCGRFSQPETCQKSVKGSTVSNAF